MKKDLKQLTCDEMVQKIVNTFIVGSDPKFLKKVQKAAKGGGVINDVGTALMTKDKKYSFAVIAPFFFFMRSKKVLFLNKDTEEAFTMPKKEWPKFYQEIKNAVSKELGK